MSSGVRHPLLSIAPGKLRPTQMTVGRAEVAQKRALWEKLGKKKRKEMLAQHWFPGVLGPKNQVYIVDHHHLGLALFEEGVKQVPVMIQRDFSWLEVPVFWHTMEFNRWAHPYDQHGQRQDYASIPLNLKDMADDPFRTLAARVRMAGGYSKDATPYSEFLWADFYRRNMKLKDGRVTAKTVQDALLFAHAHDTAYLPGWTGVIAQ
ncbi:MAG TPA: ParB-like protein [Dyella sp.]|uniref:ParB-like protein n=1 Tax=Dyella sp. TaxID=1869338 RepID=UPI002C8A2115|nr:ParB-like protein [Dyella sp.]HTV85528.1 ParB-like protein [Dyella sp.]